MRPFGWLAVFPSAVARNPNCPGSSALDPYSAPRFADAFGRAGRPAACSRSSSLPASARCRVLRAAVLTLTGYFLAPSIADYPGATLLRDSLEFKPCREVCGSAGPINCSARRLIGWTPWLIGWTPWLIGWARRLIRFAAAYADARPAPRWLQRITHRCWRFAYRQRESGLIPRSSRYSLQRCLCGAVSTARD